MLALIIDHARIRSEYMLALIIDHARIRVNADIFIA